MKKILILVFMIMSFTSLVIVKAIDSYNNQPCEYYYAVAMKFYEKDLRRRYSVTNYNAYDCIGRTDRNRFDIFFMGGGWYDVYLEGILDTDDPEIKKVIFMWGQSVDTEEGWVNTECLGITDPTYEDGKWVWGESIGRYKPFRIEEKAYEFFIERKGEYESLFK